MRDHMETDEHERTPDAPVRIATATDLAEPAGVPLSNRELGVLLAQLARSQPGVQSAPDRAKEIIRTAARTPGVDREAIMAALRALRPPELAELCADASIIAALGGELSGADLVAAGGQLSRGRVGSMAAADVDQIIRDPGHHSLGTIAAAYARDDLQSHHEAFDRTGVGTVHGNRSGTPAPTGAKPADCTTYVLDVLKRAFAAAGREDTWTKVFGDAIRNSNGPRYGSQKGLKGIEVVRALQSDAGWEAVFWAPDPGRPADGTGEHPAAHREVRNRGTYYRAPVDASRSVINYRRTDPAAPHDLTGIGYLQRLQFGVLLARGGDHMAVIVNGEVYEVHWASPATDRDAIEATPLERFEWLSGIIAAPPGDLARAWATP
jgi:hypothetical protein